MSAPAAEAKASTADASPRTEPVEPSAGSPVRDAKAAGASESKAGDAKATEAVGDPDLRSRPTVVIVIGMAGSGKTTLMQRINASTRERKTPSYIVNLDPAVGAVPYKANIDIRDTVKYKEVMKHYNLGPNGGIITALNLFATRFGQVLGFLEKRSEELKYCFMDTPGQIEVFTWSASGQIITETLASSFPTVLVYVVDTPRTTNPTTFMSNMTYACSILYKTQLPFVIAFNKTDVVSHKYAQRWMADFDAFDQAIKERSESGSYMTTFTKSLSLMLDEFYQNIKSVGVSAATGAGMDEFFEAIEGARKEYFEAYLPMVEKRRAVLKKRKEEDEQKEIEKIKREIAQSQGARARPKQSRATAETEPEGGAASATTRR